MLFRVDVNVTSIAACCIFDWDRLNVKASFQVGSKLSLHFRTLVFFFFTRLPFTIRCICNWEQIETCNRHRIEFESCNLIVPLHKRHERCPNFSLSLWQRSIVRLVEDNSMTKAVPDDLRAVFYHEPFRPKPETFTVYWKYDETDGIFFWHGISFSYYYLGRFWQIQFIDTNANLTDNIVVWISITIQHLQHQLFARQLISRNRKAKLLIEIWMRFATMNGRLTLAIVDFRGEQQTHIRITETTFIDWANVMSYK